MNPEWMKKYALYKMGIENIAMKLQMEWQNGEVQGRAARNVVANRAEVQPSNNAIDAGQQGGINPVNGNGNQGPAV